MSTYTEEYQSRIASLPTRVSGNVVVPIGTSQERSDWYRMRDSQKSDLRSTIEHIATRGQSDAERMLHRFEVDMRHRRGTQFYADKHEELSAAVEADRQKTERLGSSSYATLQMQAGKVAMTIGDPTVAEDFRFALEKVADGSLTEAGFVEILGTAVFEHDRRVAIELHEQQEKVKEAEHQAASARQELDSRTSHHAAAMDLAKLTIETTDTPA